MTVYFNSALNGVKNTLGFEAEKSSYLNRVYKNYTNFIDVKPTDYKVIDLPIKTALVISTVGIFIILSSVAAVLDFIDETVNVISRAYQSYSKPVSKFEVAKELAKENKEYLIVGAALTALTVMCIVNRQKISEYSSYIRDFFVKKEVTEKVSDQGSILPSLTLLGSSAILGLGCIGKSEKVKNKVKNCCNARKDNTTPDASDGTNGVNQTKPTKTKKKKANNSSRKPQRPLGDPKAAKNGKDNIKNSSSATPHQEVESTKSKSSWGWVKNPFKR